jgi:EAL domain-containing protein (putative c-di-GMP-specific phosphodiesterase class I)
LATFGQDVFVMTVKDDQQQLGSFLSEEIINQCSGSYHIEGKDIVITLNIGRATFPIDTQSPEDLVKNANSAMMYARKIGSNRELPFNEKIGQYVFRQNNIEIELKKVNYDQEFSLYYQPQVACDSGEIIGVEALLRWRTKDGMFIPPNEFIPITEESGQIIPLGYWIMEQAAGQLVEWKKRSSKEIRMAVNVSARQLIEKDFITHVKDILEKYHILPEQFEIEITENIQLNGNTEVLNNLEALREIGISISIDDFGTGYSSLYYLKNLSMNRIKIAKELVDQIETDVYSYSIIRMVIEMARINGIKVIAEGVELKEQWECLRDLKCDEIQGYYFAKPMTGEELFKQWLVERHKQFAG